MIADVGREPDLADAFAKYVAAARYEDLSLEAIEAAKKSTLDTIGVILGAAGTTPTLGSLGLIRRNSLMQRASHSASRQARWSLPMVLVAISGACTLASAVKPVLFQR